MWWHRGILLQSSVPCILSWPHRLWRVPPGLVPAFAACWGGVLALSYCGCQEKDFNQYYVRCTDRHATRLMRALLWVVGPKLAQTDRREMGFPGRRRSVSLQMYVQDWNCTGQRGRWERGIRQTYHTVQVLGGFSVQAEGLKDGSTRT